ncbi:9621_t:CDS:2, partial [Scutellospora calospora]
KVTGILLREISSSQESFDYESELYYMLSPTKSIISGNNNDDEQQIGINNELIINNNNNINKTFQKQVDQIEKICNDLDISFSLYNKSEIYQDFYKALNTTNSSSELSLINSKKDLNSFAIINSKIFDYMNINMNDPDKKSFHQLVQLSIKHLDNFIELKILVNSMRHLNNCNELNIKKILLLLV